MKIKWNNYLIFLLSLFCLPEKNNAQSYIDVQVNHICTEASYGNIELNFDDSVLEEYTLPFLSEWENINNGNFEEFEINSLMYSLDSLSEGAFEISIHLGESCYLNILDTLYSNACNNLEECGIIVQDSGSNQFCGDEPGSGFIDIEVFPTDLEYTYRWSRDGQILSTNQDLTNITEGEYVVQVNTMFGCTMIDTFNICCCFPDLNPIGLWPFDIDDILENDNALLCARNIEFGNLLEGVVTHATGPYSQDGDIDLSIEDDNTIGFSWTLNGMDFTGNGPDLTSLNPGLYCVDMDYGCNGVISACFLVLNQSCTDFDFTEGSNIIPQCGNENNGGIDITLNSEFEPYIFSWDIASQNEDLTNLPAGDYCVTITGSNGCTGSECFTVGDIVAPSIDNAIVNNVSDDTPNGGSIDLIISGDVSSIEWTTGETNITQINNLSEGNYCVTLVSENSNCSIIECFDVENICGNSSITADVVNGCDASITLNVDPSANVSWTYDGVFFGSGVTINNLVTGEYCAHIVNIEGDTCEECYLITSSAGDQIDEIITDCNNVISIFLEDFSGPYLVQGLYLGNVNIPIDFQTSSNPIIIDNPHNSNAVSLTIYNSCGEVYSDFLYFANELEVEISPDNVDSYCIVDFDPGYIEVSVYGGTPSYEYQWASTIDGVSSHIGPGGNSLTVNASGEYCVTVTDACDREDAACFNILCLDEPDDVILNNLCSNTDFGIQLVEDCACIGNCLKFSDIINPFGGADWDGSDIDMSVTDWNLILGTITITWPDGSHTYIRNGLGQQQIQGETEFDIEVGGTYQVLIYVDWLNLELSCEFTFSEEQRVCSPILSNTTSQAGSFYDFNSQLVLGCYACSWCGLSEEEIDYFNFSDENGIPDFCEDLQVNLLSFEPEHPENPCTGGGWLTIDCPCQPDPIKVYIEENLFAQYVDISELSGLFAWDGEEDENPWNLPCEDAQGACIFDYYQIEGAPVIDTELGNNPAIAIICPTPPEIPNDTIVPPPDELCIGSGYVIPIEEGDPCVFTYTCSEDDEEYEIPGTAAPLCSFIDYRGICMIVDYCDYGNGDCEIIESYADEMGELCDYSLPNSLVECPPCVANRLIGSDSENNTVSAPENGYFGINIYPNPATQHLNIEARDQIIQNVQVFDLNGRLLQDRNERGGIISINLRNYQKGIYLVKISTDLATKTMKFIKA